MSGGRDPALVRLERLIATPPELEERPACTAGSALPDVLTSDPKSFVWYGAAEQPLAVCRRRGGTLELVVAELGSISLGADSIRATVACSGEGRARAIDIYFRFALPRLVQALGAEVLHASGVLAGGRVVGFCGPAASGKSTTAYALQQLGCSLWADDSLVVRAGSSAFEALELPSRIRLRDDAARHFGAVPAISFSEQRSRPRSAPLAALFFLVQRDSGEPGLPALSRLAPSAAFEALYAQAIAFDVADVERNAQMVRAYFDLAEQVPCYELRYCPDLSAQSELLGLVQQALGLARWR